MFHTDAAYWRSLEEEGMVEYTVQIFYIYSNCIYVQILMKRQLMIKILIWASTMATVKVINGWCRIIYLCIH